MIYTDSQPMPQVANDQWVVPQSNSAMQRGIVAAAADPRWQVNIQRTTDSANVNTYAVSIDPASVTQRGIVAAVEARGYLNGYTLDQRTARQLVKELEEVCEAVQAIDTADAMLGQLVFNALVLGKQARAVFDTPSLFDGVTVDAHTLLEELPDLVVPLAVLADALAVRDMMDLAQTKALADVARGVRNGNQ